MKNYFTKGGLVPKSTEPPPEAFIQPKTTYLTEKQLEAYKGDHLLSTLLAGRELIIRYTS